jgi:hypothetical protein
MINWKEFGRKWFFPNVDNTWAFYMWGLANEIHENP